MLGEMRNDLYITIERGEFEKGGKSVAKNVEVTMLIVEATGQTLKVRPWGMVCGEAVLRPRVGVSPEEIGSFLMCGVFHVSLLLHPCVFFENR